MLNFIFIKESWNKLDSFYTNIKLQLYYFQNWYSNTINNYANQRIINNIGTFPV